MNLQPLEIQLKSGVPKRYEAVLNSSSLSLLVALHKHFEVRRQQLLNQREVIYNNIVAGHKPTFLPETKKIRDGDWRVDPVKNRSSTILDRTVDVVCWRVFDEKFVDECLHSGANGVQFDYDDSFSPSWYNCLESQMLLRKFVQDSKLQKFPDMLVRPRSLNLDEGNVLIEGKPISGTLFDFGVWVNTWHANSQNLDECYFYIPKIENHLEARWWNDVFSFTESYLKIEKGTFKGLVLIENILASFEMEEILYELREHCLGLNTGKWDYIFSFIKKFRHDPSFVLPDRSELTIDQTFLGAYEALLIKTCQKRGCVATGGMAPNLRQNSQTDEKNYKNV
eukprot:TRINITY_DN6344_c0_g1_i2.p1 TRINITY_DN6344_c0_g1~~TRINITY_DN6344_c0_g1_i2.p1  ORF type:complete len:345 (-),score=58.69 TRINITY_DN6344_c0_g1_i2:84-1097(-)